MTLSADFWNTNAKLLLVCGERIAFTAAGRKHFAQRMAKYGFMLSNIKTLRRFEEVMAMVNTGEREATLVTDLDENTSSLEALLVCPQTTQVERAAIRRVLGYPATA
jgi:hypothetical protein